MNTRLIGGILLILGTCIGAGLLALPISCAPQGFITSSILLIVIWIAMTISAFFLLEVNLRLPLNSNLISMAKSTLGHTGAIIMWIAYLFLLYALLCAYLSTNSDILLGALVFLHLKIPLWFASILVVFILGTIVFQGIGSVDMVNRGLMSAKLIIYVLIILAIAPHVKIPRLLIGQSKLLISTIMVIITSYGFAIIIPSLRVYLKSDAKKLRLAVFIGSLIPLISYILWIAVVHGTLSLHGKHGLLPMLKSNYPTTDLTKALIYHTQSSWITTFANCFASICALTSFLGVSLALSDFLSDGLALDKRGKNKIMLFAATFLPPLIIMLMAPGAFIKALAYAGIFCIVVLIILPAAMAWSSRYRYQKNHQGYQVWGGKWLAGLVFLFGVVIIIWDLVAMIF